MFKSCKLGERGAGAGLEAAQTAAPALSIDRGFLKGEGMKGMRAKKRRSAAGSADPAMTTTAEVNRMCPAKRWHPYMTILGRIAACNVNQKFIN